MISLNWVKDYIDLKDTDLIALADKITKAGVNVEKVITHHMDHLVVGEVKEVIEHPNSDHLHICQVDIGNEQIQIVCGASNVHKNMKVIVALPGATLPGDFTIKSGKIRDVESDGMLCALFELGLEEKTEENYNKGICELNSDAVVGTDPLATLGMDDTILELDVHKHRNNDCYYHIGFAYIIGSIINKPVTLPVSTFSEITDNVNNYIKLDVRTTKCPYYVGKMVKNVVIKESPDFIKQRLISAGMRPINNVVDISNYVMLEYGQPMHFFDYDKLGKNVVVRDAIDTEKITTLDGKERELINDDIVISDGEKAVCIAGVMGGVNTEVDNKTRNIFIESAIFNARSITRTAKRLNLFSEASTRYGKGLNYEYTSEAVNRACYLLEQYADATILSDVVKHDTLDKTPKVVEFLPSEVNSILGINITPDEMKGLLERLGFTYEVINETYNVTIPNRRLDIECQVSDIAEEIGRLYGYHNLSSTMPIVPVRRGQYIGDVLYNKMTSKRLRALGLSEVLTYTLVSKETNELMNEYADSSINLPNPMSSDKAIIRSSLLGSLLNVLDYNKLRKVNDINIYEISKTYNKDLEEDLKISMLLSGNYLNSNWQNINIKVDFYLVKGIVENVLDYLGLKNRYSFEKATYKDLHPGMTAKIIVDREEVGVIGRVHTSIRKDEIYVAELSLSKLIKPIKPIKYKEASKYPDIKKDMAFIIDKAISAEDIMMEIKRAGGRLLVATDVFDVYMGKNISDDKKSIAFNLTFSDPTRTLSDEEITAVFNNIIEKVTSKYNAELRDK